VSCPASARRTSSESLSGSRFPGCDADDSPSAHLRQLENGGDTSTTLSIRLDFATEEKPAVGVLVGAHGYCRAIAMCMRSAGEMRWS
jgi:hypothetical protein